MKSSGRLNGSSNRLVMRSILKASLACFLFLTGCSLTKVAKVDPDAAPQISKPDIKLALEKSVNDLQSDRAKQQEKRNQIIEDVRAAIDENYRKYRSGLYSGRASFETFNDFLALGITGATAVVGSASTKAALGAAATGLLGAKNSFNKNFFEDKSRDTLFARMKALRTGALVPIQAGEKKTYSDYSIESAMTDLETYYDAGTILTALEDINAETGTKQQTNLRHLLAAQ